ncbi:MAG: hypothetical protein OXR68_05640 [Alphaproteobacteria bacterium]|nr:hypothetical protein [Alphaproteobacteria bacterium]
MATKISKMVIFCLLSILAGCAGNSIQVSSQYKAVVAESGWKVERYYPNERISTFVQKSECGLPVFTLSTRVRKAVRRWGRTDAFISMDRKIYVSGNIPSNKPLLYFLVGHECGHIKSKGSELDADCYAAKKLAAKGEKKDVAAIKAGIQFMRTSAKYGRPTHPNGDIREMKILQCAFEVRPELQKHPEIVQIMKSPTS